MDLVFWFDLGVGLAALFLAGVFWASGGSVAWGWKRLRTTEGGGALPRRLRILTWNLGYAYGMGSEGVGYTKKPREHFVQTLDKMVDVLKDVDADLVLLQEVDFRCDRSHRIHQSETLARGAGYAHRADAVSWLAHWVPFPYWPPARHFGRVLSGSSVLSKHAFADHRLFLFRKPRQQAFLYRLFYPFRYTQWVGWSSGSAGKRWIVNLHLEAFSIPAREDQARVVRQLLQSPPDGGSVLVLGGDWNAEIQTPPMPSGPNVPDRTFAIVGECPRLVPAISATEAARPDQWTFPSQAPERKIDHFWVSKNVTVLRCEALKVGVLSDHLPVVIEVEFDEQ